MNIIIIVAYSLNKVIGNKGGIPWHLPKDLQLFKSLTQGHPIVMGRKTFESIGHPLPKRENIVLTQKTDWDYNGVKKYNSLEMVIKNYILSQKSKLFCIGGAKVYEQILPIATQLFLTEVQVHIKGDTYFPPINFNEWDCLKKIKYKKDTKNKYDFLHSQWKRKVILHKKDGS